MAKRFQNGDTVYLPVKIDEVKYEDKRYDYVVRIPALGGEKNGFPFGAKDEELKTAEEVAGPLKTKADAMTVTADSLQKENDKLETKVERLTTWYEEANRTASEATEANDELKAKIAELRAENEKLKADCNDWKDTADDRIVDVQNLTAENDKLKQKLKDAEGAYNVVADTSLERKNRVTTMEEVIVALVEKIRRLEGDET